VITLGIRLKNIAFLVIGALIIGYVGVTYADLGHYVGLGNYYVVHVELPQTGGLFTHSNVTYRGVSVGRVGAVRLTADGVEADLRISKSAPKIPSDLKAVVANLSAVGEEYIDLQPATADAPYLHNGSVIEQAATSTPAPVTDLLGSVDNLANSVPLADLQTVVDELGKTFANHGDDLKSLVDTGSDFIQTAAAAQPATDRLITDADTVLNTQVQEGDAIKSFAGSATQLAHTLQTSDTDLRQIIAAAPSATQEVSALLREMTPGLSVVLANLLTTSEVAVTRQDGIRQLLVKLPAVAADGAHAITPSGANIGLSVTFFSPLPCTSGYGGTTYRNGLDTSAGRPLNTGAGCTSPASSGIDVRGSAHAPYGGGVPAAVAPGSLLPVGGGGTNALPSALGLPAASSGGAPSGIGGLLGLGG
jgi:phospholipid/cholesterol/gamma-HCH transport system substrate-binding protein